MAEFFQFVIGGLAIGSVYGLVALGFVLIFKSTDVFNFAQGDLLMVGGYLLFTMVATLHLPMIPAIVAVLAAGAVIGILLQAVVFRSMIGRPLLTVVMVTIALSLVIRSVMQIVYGTQERTLPHTLPNDSFAFLGVRISTVMWNGSDPRDPRTFIAPDLPAMLTFADWLAHKDPALDAIRAYRPAKDAPDAPPNQHWGAPAKLNAVAPKIAW